MGIWFNRLFYPGQTCHALHAASLVHGLIVEDTDEDTVLEIVDGAHLDGQNLQAGTLLQVCDEFLALLSCHEIDIVVLDVLGAGVADDLAGLEHPCQEDEEEVGSSSGDYENIVNYGRNIDGVEVSIFVRQVDNKFKVSMRSNEYLDVSLIATKYGGGGHMKAAGLTTDMSVDLIKKTLVSEIEKVLK